jgi:hypothetical protein
MINFRNIWVFRKNLGDTNEAWCLSLFLCSENEAQLPHNDLRSSVTIFSDGSQGIKGQDLGLFIIS